MPLIFDGSCRCFARLEWVQITRKVLAPPNNFHYCVPVPHHGTAASPVHAAAPQAEQSQCLGRLNLGWLGTVLINSAQLLDASTSILFLFLNTDVEGSCRTAGILTIVASIIGMCCALGGAIICIDVANKPRTGVVGITSFFTNLVTLIVAGIVAHEGVSFEDCSSKRYQGPIAFPALLTAAFACWWVDV